MSGFVDLAKDYDEAVETMNRVFADYQSAQDKVRNLGARMASEIGRNEKAPGKKLVATSRTHGAPHAAAVREWAKANKMKCPDRGRIPNSILEAYNAAHHRG